MQDYETELLSSQPSDRLAQLQLCLLRYVSSQKGLNLAMKDEYTRRQFQKRLPRFNPFGDEDEPESFTSFDAPTKVRVLYHLSCWTLINPHRIRERLPAGDDEKQWRVEPYGCDRLGRSYMVLDDNRLYRRTDPPPPPPPPKSKSKSSAKKNRRSAAHAHKRRRTGQAEESEADEEEATPAESNLKDVSAFADDDFGGATWECVAITLTQYKDLLDSFKKSKVEAELDLHAYLVRDCLPVILDLEEKRLRKEERRAHESRQVEMLTNAKRSSRIADRSQKQKEEELLHEQARQEAALKAAARKEETRLKKLEELQYQRAQGREQRLKEREERRITHETKLENLKNGLDEEAEGRKSERQRAVDMQKYQEELAKTAEEEQEWIIDCSGCGFHGVFRDVLGDGKDVVECEKCHAWEHQACLGITDEQAGQETFHFVCKPCHRKAAEASRPRFIIKLTSPSNAQKAAAIPTNGTSTPDAKHTGTSPPQPRPVMAQFAPPSFPPQDRYSMSQIKEPFNGPGSLSVAPSATPPLVNGHSEHSTDSSKPDGRYGIDRPNGHPAIMFQPLVSAYPPLTPSTVTSPNLAPEYAFQHQSSDYTLHQSTVERLPDQQMTSSVHTSLTSGKQP